MRTRSLSGDQGNNFLQSVSHDETTLPVLGKPLSEPVEESELLDVYSKAVVQVAEKVSPSVVKMMPEPS